MHYTLRPVLLAVLSSTLALLSVNFISQAEPQRARQNAFDPSGNFHVIISQDAHLDSEYLAVIELEKKNGRKPTFSGKLVMALGSSTTPFRFITSIITPEKFTFTTSKVGGVSYTFSGKFLRRGNFLEDWNRDERPFDQAVLEGTLTKFKDGRKTSEKSFKFTYSVGD